VIAMLRGSEEPDQWVIRGNHHDAWVNGATDPSSGMAAVLAEAKALSALVAQGWKPRRTIVFAAWDAEEPGLLGSTEWVETHARELGAQAVAYVNSDSNSRGYLDMAGSHSLQRLLNEIARDVGATGRGTSGQE
jgi:N-acetylated-alpha-linked acidic dipeptidase